jgi:hypothetical protein
MEHSKASHLGKDDKYVSRGAIREAILLTTIICKARVPLYLAVFAILANGSVIVSLSSRPCSTVK